MKKNKNLRCITALAAVIAFTALSLTGCSNEAAASGNSNTTAASFTSIADMQTWLKNQPANTPVTAYTVKLNVGDLGGDYLTNGSAGYAILSNWTKYVSLDLSGSTFTNIGSAAFRDCENLTSVTIPDSVTMIASSAFIQTTWLDNQPDGVVYLGKWAYSYKGDMPANTSITLLDGTKGIAENAFHYCRSLTSVTIPDSVTSIGGSAFYGCTGLTSVTIPNSVTTIRGSVFQHCESLTTINVAADNVNYSSEHGILYNKDKTVLIIYPGEEVGAFTIPDHVTSIGEEAFNGCGKLTSITIPNSVTSIGDYAFFECWRLTSVTIPDSVTSIGEEAFFECLRLTTIDVDAANTAYSSEQGILYNKDKTVLIVYPRTKDGAFTIPDSVTSIGYKAFQSCNYLTSITIPDSVTSIGEEAFRGCTNLTSVTISDSVTSIGKNAFGICWSLTSVTIGNSVTSIGGHAFFDCTSLTSVTIPNSVTSIGDMAFSGCTSLASVTFQGTIAADNFDKWTFNGDLREKYLAAGGGIGTYKTTAPADYDAVWTKQP